MRAEEPGNGQSQPPQEDRDSIWSIPLARRALYFGLFTAYALAGISFLLWYEILEHKADTWPETILSITQGIGVTTVGAAGLALLTIEGPQTFMVVADYLRKRLIEPLEEKRRIEAERRREEAEQRREQARAEAEERVARIHAEGHAEGQAQTQAVWEAWNGRRVAAEARGEPFDESPPELPMESKQDDDGQPPVTSSTEGG